MLPTPKTPKITIGDRAAGHADKEAAMAILSGLFDRHTSGASAGRVTVADAVSATGGGMADVARSGSPLWDIQLVFILIVSFVNAGLWWGICTLLFGSAWSMPVLVFCSGMWLLTVLAMSLCAMTGEE